MIEMASQRDIAATQVGIELAKLRGLISVDVQGSPDIIAVWEKATRRAAPALYGDAGVRLGDGVLLSLANLRDDIIQAMTNELKITELPDDAQKIIAMVEKGINSSEVSNPVRQALATMLEVYKCVGGILSYSSMLRRGQQAPTTVQPKELVRQPEDSDRELDVLLFRFAHLEEAKPSEKAKNDDSGKASDNAA